MARTAHSAIVATQHGNERRFTSRPVSTDGSDPPGGAAGGCHRRRRDARSARHHRPDGADIAGREPQGCGDAADPRIDGSGVDDWWQIAAGAPVRERGGRPSLGQQPVVGLQRWTAALATSQRMSTRSASARISVRWPGGGVVVAERRLEDGERRLRDRGPEGLVQAAQRRQARRPQPSRRRRSPPTSLATHTMTRSDRARGWGLSMESSNAANRSRAVSAAASAPASIAVANAAHASSARAGGSRDSAIGRSWSIHARASPT